MAALLAAMTVLLLTAPAQAFTITYAELASALTPITLVDVSQLSPQHAEGAVILHPAGTIYQRQFGCNALDQCSVSWTLIFLPDGQQVRELQPTPFLLSLVNDQNDPPAMSVPVPPTILLLGAGVVVGVLVSRRRR